VSTGRGILLSDSRLILAKVIRLGPPDAVVPCRASCDDGGSEIARCDGEIDAEMERARDAVAEKGRALHDERERVQKAALAALDVLSGGRGAI
jgi:hypothetical protein